MTFDYLRYYTTIEDGCKKFGVSSRTYGDHVNKVIRTSRYLKFISQICDREKQKVEDLTKSGELLSNKPYLTLAIDTSFFKINTKDFSFYNPKYGSKGVKYEFGCSLYDGEILWMNGPFKPKVSDISIFRSGLGKVKMGVGERFIGDKGYQGEASKILTPIKELVNTNMSGPEKLENRFIKKKRSIIENVFCVLNKFESFNGSWKSNLERHRDALVLIVYAFNLSINVNRINNTKYFAKDFIKISSREDEYYDYIEEEEEDYNEDLISHRLNCQAEAINSNEIKRNDRASEKSNYKSRKEGLYNEKSSNNELEIIQYLKTIINTEQKGILDLTEL